ncbi:MAG: hypothetical protein AAF456_14845 [Planctomycetota bacterium]
MKRNYLTILIAFALSCRLASDCSAQQSIPSAPYEAAQWLETNHCNVTKNSDGEVTGVELSYLPRVFVIGDLEVFPSLETVELTYSSRLNDSHMSGIARLTSLKKIVIRNCDSLTEASLSVLHYLPNLEEIELSSCDSIFNLAPLRACQNLKRVKIADSAHFNFYGLQKIVTLPGLVQLELNDNSTLRDEHLELLRDATGLESLVLIGCDSITDQGLEVLKELPALRRLNLFRCSQVTGTALEHVSAELEFLVLRQTGFNADGLSHLRRLTRLKELYFGHHDSFNDESLLAIASSQQLEKLALDGVAVNDQHFSAMAECRNLKVLYLTECDNVTGESLARLAGSQLEVLELIRCKRIDSPDLQSVALFSGLRHLDLTGTRIRAEGIAHLTTLENLEFLNLSDCKWVDDECLGFVGQLPSLNRLKLLEVKRVSDSGIAALGTMPSLRSLSISDNRQVTGEGFGSFSAESPLKTLELFRLDNLSPDGLHCLVGLANLERLQIECRHLNNDHLLAMQGIPRLKSFEIEEIENVDAEVYRRFYHSLPSYEH